MRKVLCADCKTKQVPFRPLYWIEGAVHWVCKRCWCFYNYDPYMHPERCDCPHCEDMRRRVNEVQV